MTLLVCAATGAELAALAPRLLPEEQKPEEMHPWLQTVGGRRILFCVTGVGPINAALALGFCFGQTSPANREPITAVLNVGLAGAFDLNRQPLRSLWLVREEIWPEYGLNDGQTVTARAFSFPLWKGGLTGANSPSEPDYGPDIYDRLPLAGTAALKGESRAIAEEPFPVCRSITVAGVSAGFARARKLFDCYRAELENMEGFAVAYACARAGVPCVQIRSVSNKVGPRGKDEKDFPGALRSLAAILPSLNLM